MRALLFLLALSVSTLARAGAGAADEHDEHEGPAFYGFVKDTGGVPVRDARVEATYGKSVSFIARTNAAGAYKFIGFRNDIKLDEVVISCSKEGYRQVRVFRYPPPKGKPVKSVETECRLQRQP